MADVRRSATSMCRQPAKGPKRRGLAYYDPPAKKGGKPKLVGHYPCVLFGTVAPDGRRHAHRIYVAPDGQGMGRCEARQELGRLLRDAPSAEVIDAIPAIADEDCIILLGRLLRTQPGLAGAARDALEMIDHPRARQIVAAMTVGRAE